MVFIIGVSGPTTSGKSTISEALQKKYNCKIICVDSYFKINVDLPKEEINGRTVLNFDSPDSVEWNYFIEDIQKEINKMKQTKTTNYLIVEGFLLFGTNEIKEMVDMLITVEFNVDTDEDIAFHRRLNRLNEKNEEEEVPEEYMENPEKNRIAYTAFYFKSIAWKKVKENQPYVCPDDWTKPLLKLSATADINENIEKSVEFIESNSKRNCRI